MDDAKSGDATNVVYLNTIHRITRIYYAQVSEVEDGKAVGLIRDGGDVIPVQGVFGDQPDFAVGDWVRALDVPFGARIMMRLDLDKESADACRGLEPGRWYELFSPPSMRIVSIEAVRDGWIMSLGNVNYIHLDMEAMVLKDQDGHLLYVEKSREESKFTVSDGYEKYMVMSYAFKTRSLNICLYKPYDSN